MGLLPATTDLPSHTDHKTEAASLPDHHRSDLLPPPPPVTDINRVSDRSSLDSGLSMVLPRYPGLDIQRYSSTHHQPSDTRFPSEARFPSSPPFTLPGSQSNLAILGESRALTTLPLPATHGSYPLMSPHSLFAGTSPTTTLGSATSYLASSPTMLSTSFLYPHLYSGSPSQSQYQYLEGRALEGSKDLGSTRSRLSLTPPSESLKMDTTPPDNRSLKDDQHHMAVTRTGLLPESLPPQTTSAALPRDHPIGGPLGPLAPPHDNGDPSSVWRPYWIKCSILLNPVNFWRFNCW